MSIKSIYLLFASDCEKQMIKLGKREAERERERTREVIFSNVKTEIAVYKNFMP